MEREYDRDTWKMYEQIQWARISDASRSGGTLFDSKRGPLSTIRSDSDRDDSCSSYLEDPLAVIGVDHDEPDTMFELDLE
jgi:hypothetical protein